MPPKMTLSDSDADLLVQMLCCVIAADKRVSGKEVQVVANTLAAVCSTLPLEAVKEVVVKYCKEIHAKGVDKYIAELLPRLAARQDSAIAGVFGQVQQALIAADGESSPEEERVAASLLAAFRDQQNKGNSAQSATEPAGSSEPSVVAVGSDSVPAAGCIETEPWKVALAIGLCFPYGLYLLWNHPTLNKSKWWWRGAVAYSIYALIVMASAGTNKQKSSRAPESPKDSVTTSASNEYYDKGVSEGRPLGESYPRQPVATIRIILKQIQKIRDHEVANLQQMGPSSAKAVIRALESNRQYAQGRLDGFVQGLGERVKEL